MIRATRVIEKNGQKRETSLWCEVVSGSFIKKRDVAWNEQEVYLTSQSQE
jgi:hypothetical protein